MRLPRFRLWMIMVVMFVIAAIVALEQHALSIVGNVTELAKYHLIAVPTIIAIAWLSRPCDDRVSKSK
jgi:hypothetical protein